MFQYHGWITVQSSAGDEETADLRAAAERAAEAIAPLEGGSGLLDLRWVNGMAQIHLAGFVNHRAGEGQQAIDVYRRIGEVAPGSYGLLHVLDDEDPAGRQNEFQVFAMRRGKITVLPDAALSPAIPVIEDAD